MTHHVPDSTTITNVLEHLTEEGFEGMAAAMELLINEAMKLERSEYLGAGPYERSAERQGFANGFKPKRVKTRVGELQLAVPKTRGHGPDTEPFYPSSLGRGLRSERALTLAVAEMYVQGVSTRKVAEVTRELCGLDITSQQVSRAAALLDEELEAWRTRPLGEHKLVVLDARYEKVRHGGHVRSVAVLVATGVNADGKRSIIGASTSLSEAEVHWRGFLRSLVQRGLEGTVLITSDDHQGLKAAMRAVFPGVLWQRCQCHLQRNAIAYVPKVEMREPVALDIRSIFNAPDKHEADRLLAKTVEAYRESAPRLAEWMEANLPEGLAVFALPVHQRRRMRTSNMLERLNRELKRRTRVATLFPNEASLLRLVSAVLVEVSEEWETGKIYLRMDQA
jgi:transposase-like protein